MLNKIKDFNLVEWSTKNKFKLVMTWVVLTTLISFFMLALTFNFIGNDISSSSLIVGFTFGVLASLVGGTVGFLLHKNRNFDIVNLALIATLSVFFLISIIFGSIGYLDAA